MQSAWAKQKAFTIVELLIVIVVIAILAAITIVAYTGVQGQTHDSVVQSELASAARRLELFNVENGRYPITAGELDSLAGPISNVSYKQYANAMQYCYNTTTGAVALGAVSSSGAGFIYKYGKIVKVSGWSAGPNVAVCTSSLSFPMPTGSYAIWRNPAQATWGGVAIS